MHMHKHKHIHTTHACMHTQIYNAHKNIYTTQHKHMHTHTHIHIHPHTPTPTHTNTQTQAHTVCITHIVAFVDHLDKVVEGGGVGVGALRRCTRTARRLVPVDDVAVDVVRLAQRVDGILEHLRGEDLAVWNIFDRFIN